MNQTFRGWAEVARHLRETAQPSSPSAALLDDGQRASLVAIADRIASNGVILADEVGMGKTRIAVFVAKAVTLSGGRTAVVIPPGLGFQWKKEFHDCGTDVNPVIRSLQGYLEAWGKGASYEAPWFQLPVVMVSHLFANWRLRSNPQTWRWWLLPAVYAAARKLKEGRVPRGYYDANNDHRHDSDVQRVVAAAGSIVGAASSWCMGPANRLVTELLSEVRWPDPLDARRFSNGQPLRGWLEKIVGLGLGAFDLIIVDEAHKNRSLDGCLSRVLENVLLQGHECRRLALTATPIELDASQWDSTLKRLGATAAQRAPIAEATEAYAEAIHKLRLGWRTSSEARDGYRTASKKFEQALSNYLLRRDKRDDEAVCQFVKVSGLSQYAYRRLHEVTIDVVASEKSPEWRQVVCAAEALSVVREPMTDIRTRRLRLTIGSGHGLASVMDEVLCDENEDKKQIEEECAQADGEREGVGHAQGTESPASKSRVAWWSSVLRGALKQTGSLFDHPAILAAVSVIEEEAAKGEKVLVFGRFTRPMRILVNLLNARQMLMAVEHDQPWPQRKVHDDPREREYGEWPAVRAAYRQLSSKIDLSKLNDILSRRYRQRVRKRASHRNSLLARVRAGLGKIESAKRYEDVLNVIRSQSVAAASGTDEDDYAILLARAIAANTYRQNPDDEDLARAFQALVDAVGDHDGGEEDEFDEEQASDALWDHLQDAYSSQQGGFARLMYGETKPQTRRLIQLAFNRPNSLPRVLVAQSLVGREGLNLHESCRIVVLLHPEWNPGVVEQQIGRVDRVNSKWAKALQRAVAEGVSREELPRIEVRPIIFMGTYDEHNWRVLQERWDDLRAQLHGEAVPARLRECEDDDARRLLDEIAKARPNFSPQKD